SARSPPHRSRSRGSGRIASVTGSLAPSGASCRERARAGGGWWRAGSLGGRDGARGGGRGCRAVLLAVLVSGGRAAAAAATTLSDLAASVSRRAVVRLCRSALWSITPRDTGGALARRRHGRRANRRGPLDGGD